MGEIALGIFMLGFVGGSCVLAYWLAFVRPHAMVRAALSRICRQVPGLTLPAGKRQWVPRVSGSPRLDDSWPAARGYRDGLPVLVSASIRMKHEPAVTFVQVTWPEAIVPRVGIMTSFAQQYMHAMSRIPTMAWMRSSLAPGGFRDVELPWFAQGVAWGDEVEFDRVFDVDMQALLKDFPRELSSVAFEADTATVRWFGQEQDPAVIEQGFRTARACLELLARRRRSSS